MKNIEQHLIHQNASLREAFSQIDALHTEILTLFVVDNDKRLLGTINDSTIRSAIAKGAGLDTVVTEAMQSDFKYIVSNELDVRQIKTYRENGVELIPCLDDSHHIITVYDLNSKQTYLPLDAVIMAGGKGERMRPMTDTVPKPLLPVGKKTIIDHNVDHLISCGIEPIYVTINYLGEQIENHYKEPRDGTIIRCIREQKYLGTIGALKCIECFKHDEILVMNSDLFTDVNFEEFYLNFIENDAAMSVAAVPYTISVPYGIFSIEANRINGIMEKPTLNYYANSGIYLMKKEVVNLIPDNTFFNATDLIDLLVSKGEKVLRYPLAGYWIDIGSKEEYMKANELAKHLV